MQVRFPDSWTYSRDVQGLRLEYARIVSEQWQAKLGVQSTVQTGALSNIYDKWIETNFDIHWGGGWGGRPARLDPQTFLNAFSSGDASDINYCNYDSEEYTEVIGNVRSSTNEEERVEYVYRAQEILNEDVPVLFMFATNALTAANTENWENYTLGVGSRPLTNVWNWQSMQNTGGSDSAAVMADTRFPTTINPMGLEANIDMVAAKFFYDRLFRLDTEGNPKPWAASDWTAQDSSTYDVTIQDDMTFHDGEPVEPENIQFTIEYYQEWEVPYIQSFYGVIDQVEILGENKVRFHLNGPNAAFVSTSLSQLLILPKHIWDGVAEQQGLEHPRNWSGFDKTGSGPLTVESYDSSGRIVYGVHDNHFSQFNLSRFVMNSYGGKSVALGDVENGNASYLEELQPNQYERVKSQQKIKASEAPSHGWGAIYLNNSRPPLNDKVMRQALFHAMDKELILETVFSGYADAIAGPIPPAMERWHNPELEAYDGGTEQARSILLEAGYKWDQNGNLLMPNDVATASDNTASPS